MAIATSIGEMRTVVIFQTNTQTVLGAGRVDSYSTLLTTRGKLTTNNGNRSLDFGELILNSSYELICRVRQDLIDNLNAEVRLSISGDLYTIASYELFDQKKSFYRFILNKAKR